MNNKTTLVLEWSAQRLKLCLVQSAGSKLAVRSLQVFDFEREVTNADIVSALASIKYDRLLIALPRSFFLVRFLKLPAGGKQELAKMLPFQLAKSAPFSLEEVLYDFSEVEVEQNLSKVIAFLVQKRKIAPLLEFLQRGNISPAGFAITSEGLARWVRRQDKSTSGEEVLVVEIDKDSVDFAVVSQGRLTFSRAAAASSDEEIAAVIDQSLQIYQKEFGRKEFAKTIFTGRDSELAASRVNFSDTRFVSGLANCVIDGGLREKIEEQEFSFASLLGLAAGALDLDFSPAFVKQDKAGGRKKKRYFDIGVLFFQIALIAGILLAGNILKQYRRLKFLSSRLAQITLETKGLDEVADKLKILDRQLNKEAGFSQVLYELVSLLPANTQLTLLDFQDDGEFSLKAYAPEPSVAFKLAAALNESALFKGVKVRYASRVQQQGQTKVEFYLYGERQ